MIGCELRARAIQGSLLFRPSKFCGVIFRFYDQFWIFFEITCIIAIMALLLGVQEFPGTKHDLGMIVGLRPHGARCDHDEASS